MGGRTGGWDHRDQDAFIKVWTQTGCSPVILYDDSSGSSHSTNDGHSEHKREVEYSEQKGNDEHDMHKRNFEDDADEQSYAVVGDEYHDKLGESNSDEKYPEKKGKIKKVSEMQIAKMSLPRGQISSLLRRLPVAVPGKSHEELEEHITW